MEIFQIEFKMLFKIVFLVTGSSNYAIFFTSYHHQNQNEHFPEYPKEIFKIIWFIK